jgi:uncharacterized protein YdgA (DUF945 family)
MRKVGIVLGCIVVLALLATPLVGGLLARKAHDVLVANLDQVGVATSGAVRIANEGFDLGWLSSTSRMRVDLGVAGSPLQFTLRHVIHHGPLPMGRLTRGPSLAVIDTTVEDVHATDGADAFVGETVIDMTGDVGVDLTSLALPRRDDMAWEGGSARLRVEGQGTRIAVQLNAPRFELRNATGEVTLQKLAIDYTSERMGEGPGVGTATYAIERARMSTPASRNAAVDRFSWTSTSAQNAVGRFDVSGVLRLGALDLDDLSYRDVAFEISLRNLDENAVGALDALRSQITDAGTRAAQTASQLTPAIQAAFVQHLPAILASSPQIEIKSAHVQTLDGPVDLELRLQADPAVAAAPSGEALRVQGRLVVPLPIFEALTQRAAAEVSPAAVSANDTQSLDIIADQIAEIFLTRGYFSEEADGRLASDIGYRASQLELNGNPVVLSELLMQTGGLPQ